MLNKLYFRRIAYSVVLTWSILAVSLASSVQAADLHVIMVGDLEAEDLKEAIKLDLKNIHLEAEKISSYTNLKLKEVLFSGPKARTNEILKQLKNLKVNEEDVVIFYFTGHGYRTPSKGESPWPNLYFFMENKGIDLATVIDILNEKPAHLILTVTDCCNNFIPDSYAPPVTKEVVNGFGSNDLIKANYRKLFLESEGLIAISSSRAGQTSLCTNKGSFYTLAFLESIAKVVKSPKDIVSWQSVLDNASYRVSSLAQQYDDEQDPIFTILLRDGG